LVPKKSKDLHKLVAEELGFTEDLVRDAVGMYWHDVRKALTDMSHHAIYVEGLGTFKSKEKRLTEALEEYERLYLHNKGDSFRRMAMKTELGSRIEKIKHLLDLMNKDKHKKQLIKDKRNGKLDHKNLEEQVVDPGRTQEPDIQETSSGTDFPKENEDM
jgi:nucleoid DNA-binding protein